MARKFVDGRAVYLCHNDFGDFDGKPALKKMFPKITDFGLAERGDQPGPRIHPIQPAHCHAPEVLLGTGWSYSADIWNFGIMVFIMFLFTTAPAKMAKFYVLRFGISLQVESCFRRSTARTTHIVLNITWQK